MGKRFAVMGGLAFAASLFLTGFTQGAATGVPPLLAAFILVLVILSGIVFDVLGVAATTAAEKPLHALASDRVFGASQAIRLVRRRDLVATVTNDMIGDILGTIGGAMGATLAAQLSLPGVLQDPVVRSVVIVAGTAGLTVGGKAGFKRVALRHNQDIVLLTGRVLALAERVAGRSFLGNTRDGRRIRWRARRR